MADIYSEVSRDLYNWANATKCPFCEYPLTDLDYEDVQPLVESASRQLDSLYIAFCSGCHWASARAHCRDSTYWGARQVDFGAVTCIKVFDIADAKIPVDILRRQLRKNFSRRFDIHPRKMEELVGAIFKEQGYDTLLTKYSGDGGIDAFLTKGNSTVGVQVKRFRDAIEVSEIREFAGALLAFGLKQGVFVTTSRFTRGSHRIIQDYSKQGYSIDLLDSTDLLDALRISNTAPDFRQLVANLHFVHEWHDW